MEQPYSRNLQFLNVGATITTILINVLSNTPILGQKNVDEVSDAHPTLFTPAGYVFSIWAVIYALLLVFTVYQVLPKQRGSPFIGKIRYFYALGSLANMVWIILWVNEYVVLSTVMMFILFASLVAIYLRLNIGKSQVGLREKLCVQLPFSVYLGWITVAAIGNVAISLTVVNWGGWGLGDVFWTMLMIAVATLVTLLVIYARRDIGYSLVIIWALLGIIAKQMGNMNIVLAAGIASIMILAAIALMTVMRVRRY